MSAIRGTLGIKTAKQFEKISGEIDAETAHKRAAFAPLEKATPFQTKIATLLERILLTGVPIKNVKELSRQTGKQDGDKKRLKDDDDILHDDQKRSKPGRQLGRMALGYGVSSAIGAINSNTPVEAITGTASGIGSGLMMTGNPAAMIAGAAMQIGGAIVKSFYGAEDRLAKGFQPLAGIRDMDARNLANHYVQGQEAITNFGFSVSELAQREVFFEKSRGGYSDKGQLIKDLITSFGLERVGLMNENLASQLVSLQRSEINPRTFDESIIAASRITGGKPELLEESLQILIGISQEQLKILGRVNIGVNEKVVGNLIKMGGIMSNPQVAAQVYAGLQKGLTTASSPQVEALQFEALRQIMPGASLPELMRIREQGLQGDYGRKYAKSMVNYVRQISGGNLGLQQINFAAMTGLSQNVSYEFLKKYAENQEEGLKFLDEELDDGLNLKKILATAKESTSVLQRTGAKEYAAQIFGLPGDKVIRPVKTLQDYITQLTPTTEPLSTRSMYTVAKTGMNPFPITDATRKTIDKDEIEKKAKELFEKDEKRYEKELNEYYERMLQNYNDTSLAVSTLVEYVKRITDDGLKLKDVQAVIPG